MKFTVALLTISDKVAAGSRIDESGPALERVMRGNQEFEVILLKILPDDRPQITKELTTLCDVGFQGRPVDLILTTGGTGVSPRDVTPEATLDVVERLVPGIPELLRMEGAKKTPRAAISRAVAGVRRRTLIVNLPGSPRAAAEQSALLHQIVPHLLEKLSGDESDCAT